MRIKTLFIILFGCLVTTGSTDKQASFEFQSAICTLQGRLVTEHETGSKKERVALVLNQQTNLETTVELMGTGLAEVAQNRGFRAEIEVEVREDILGAVTWGKFRRLKRVLDPYEETEEYFTTKSIREVCRGKKAAAKPAASAT